MMLKGRILAITNSLKEAKRIERLGYFEMEVMSPRDKADERRGSDARNDGPSDSPGVLDGLKSNAAISLR
ncbi:MAG: hypothetical protein MO853_04525 [Candidatus Protistobacter heckmanni]|nr:hypothetical protein [Candidatus Protistobacter heckmanni]